MRSGALEHREYRRREKHVAVMTQLDHQDATNVAQIDGVGGCRLLDIVLQTRGLRLGMAWAPSALGERRRRCKLDAMKLGVNAVARDQVRMGAVFDNAPGIEHRDAVDAFDGG